jgi:hypothetical protein
MTFTFKQYGCFTGPNSNGGDYNYDAVSQENFWNTDLPVDTSFKLTDVAMVLYNVPGDYVGMYINGSATSVLTMAKSTGTIPTLIIQADNTIINGKTITNNSTITNGSVVINGNEVVNGTLNVTGSISGPTITSLQTQIATKKSFDIPHPTKENHRLRYICLEGPGAEVYFRGKLEDQTEIEIPEYWTELVDIETIGIQLTPIGNYQELFVEKIEWGRKIIVRNNAGSSIKCYYTVTGERKDVEKNIPEYPGTSPRDYPGDNSGYIINGY